MTPAALTDYLHRSIPLTAALGARVVCCDESLVEIAAPLAPNTNHRNTAFGGSLAALAMVSGWSVLYLALASAELRCRLVIQSCESEFLNAATGDLLARSRLPEADWPRFLATLARHPRARIGVDSEVVANRVCALRQRGRYVALRDGVDVE